MKTDIAEDGEADLVIDHERGTGGHVVHVLGLDQDQDGEDLVQENVSGRENVKRIEKEIEKRIEKKIENGRKEDFHQSREII